MNYLPVLLAAIAAFFLGWIWHGPLFGKQWMILMNFTPERIKGMKMKPGVAMTFGFIGCLLTAGVLSYLGTKIGVAAIGDIMCLAFWLWLGFIATTLANGPLWEDRSVKLYVFNIVYALISIELMAVVLGAWL